MIYKCIKYHLRACFKMFLVGLCLHAHVQLALAGPNTSFKGLLKMHKSSECEAKCCTGVWCINLHWWKSSPETNYSPRPVVSYHHISCGNTHAGLIYIGACIAHEFSARIKGSIAVFVISRSVKENISIVWLNWQIKK